MSVDIDPKQRARALLEEDDRFIHQFSRTVALLGLVVLVLGGLAWARGADSDPFGVQDRKAGYVEQSGQ